MFNNSSSNLSDDVFLCDFCGLTETSGDTTFEVYNLIVIVIALPTVAVIGALGSVVSAWVYLSPSMRTSSANNYLTALACSDFFVATTAVFVFTFQVVRHRDATIRAIFLASVAEVYPFAMIAQTSSVYFTVVAALDCFVSVVRPTLKRTLCTPKAAVRACASVVVFSIFYNLSHFFEISVKSCYLTSQNKWVREVCATSLRLNATYNTIYYVYGYTIIMTVAPLVLLIILNMLIVSTLKIKKRRAATKRKKALMLSPTTVTRVLGAPKESKSQIISEAQQSMNGSTSALHSEAEYLMGSSTHFLRPKSQSPTSRMGRRKTNIPTFKLPRFTRGSPTDAEKHGNSDNIGHGKNDINLNKNEKNCGKDNISNNSNNNKNQYKIDETKNKNGNNNNSNRNYRDNDTHKIIDDNSIQQPGNYNNLIKNKSEKSYSVEVPCLDHWTLDNSLQQGNNSDRSTQYGDSARPLLCSREHNNIRPPLAVVIKNRFMSFNENDESVVRDNILHSPFLNESKGHRRTDNSHRHKLRDRQQSVPCNNISTRMGVNNELTSFPNKNCVPHENSLDDPTQRRFNEFWKSDGTVGSLRGIETTTADRQKAADWNATVAWPRNRLTGTSSGTESPGKVKPLINNNSPKIDRLPLNSAGVPLPVSVGSQHGAAVEPTLPVGAQETESEDPLSLIMVVCMFIACNSLALIINVLEGSLGALLTYMVDLSNLLVVFNSSINFFIYVALDPKFRNELRRKVARILRKAGACSRASIRDQNSSPVARKGFCKSCCYPDAEQSDRYSYIPVSQVNETVVSSHNQATVGSELKEMKLENKFDKTQKLTGAERTQQIAAADRITAKLPEFDVTGENADANDILEENHLLGNSSEKSESTIVLNYSTSVTV